MKQLIPILVLFAVSLSATGCWLAAGAVGAEAGYVATQDDRSAGETLDDQVLHTRVKTKLLADNEVSGFDINVDVFKKVVTLRGYMQTQEEIDHAIQVAAAVEGVRQVDSRLVLDR